MRRSICFAILALAAMPSVAGATLPGRNGEIAFGGWYDNCWDYAAATPHARAADCSGWEADDLVAVSPRGTPKRIIFSAGQEPSYSPSGREVAFTDANSSRMFIKRAARGSRAQSFQPGAAAPPARDVDSSPTWSGTGNRLAFARSTEGPSRVFTVNRDGSALTDLVEGQDPDWSSAGRIAFTRGTQIYSMNESGGDLRPIARGAEPSWSPGGRWLAFTRRVGRQRHVFIVRSNGFGTRRVTRGPFTCSSPAWSPDGRRIAVVRGTSRLLTVRPDGTKSAELGRVPAGYSIGGTAWQPLPRAASTQR